MAIHQSLEVEFNKYEWTLNTDKNIFEFEQVNKTKQRNLYKNTSIIYDVIQS